MPEGKSLVLPGGYEFLSYVAIESRVKDRPHYPGVIDFLIFIELGSTRISCGMIMADDFLVLLDSANHVPVHYLNVIDVEE